VHQPEEGQYVLVVAVSGTELAAAGVHNCIEHAPLGGIHARPGLRAVTNSESNARELGERGVAEQAQPPGHELGELIAVSRDLAKVRIDELGKVLVKDGSCARVSAGQISVVHEGIIRPRSSIVCNSGSGYWARRSSMFMAV
jgi:hypothetical protein